MPQLQRAEWLFQFHRLIYTLFKLHHLLDGLNKWVKRCCALFGWCFGTGSLFIPTKKRKREKKSTPKKVFFKMWMAFFSIIHSLWYQDLAFASYREQSLLVVPRPFTSAKESRYLTERRPQRCTKHFWPVPINTTDDDKGILPLNSLFLLDLFFNWVQRAEL